MKNWKYATNTENLTNHKVLGIVLKFSCNVVYVLVIFRLIKYILLARVIPGFDQYLGTGEVNNPKLTQERPVGVLW